MSAGGKDGIKYCETEHIKETGLETERNREGR